MDSGSSPATAMLSAVVLSFLHPSTPSLILELPFFICLQPQSPHTTPKYLVRNTAAPRVVMSSPAAPLSRASLWALDPIEPSCLALTSTMPLFLVPVSVAFPLFVHNYSIQCLTTFRSLLRWYPVQHRHWLLHLRRHLPQVAIRCLRYDEPAPARLCCQAYLGSSH